MDNYYKPPCLTPSDMAVQMKLEEPDSSQVHVNTIVKEEFIIEELPPEPHCDGTVISTSGYEITIKNEPTDHDEPETDQDCGECKRVFHRNEWYKFYCKRHENIDAQVEDEGPFQCKICGKCLESNESLSKHSLKFHNEDQKVNLEPVQMEGSESLKCPRCPATFTCKKVCGNHIRRHKIMDKATYQCKTCLKCFGDKRALIKHEQAATQNNMKSQCLKNRTKLEFEPKTHEQTDKEYHVIEGNGAFMCSGCNNVFLQRDRCVSHILRHEYIDQGKHKCPTCGENFGSAQDVMRHAQKKHGEEVAVATRVKRAPVATERDENGQFVCPECPAKYDNRKTCVDHMRKHKNLLSAKYQCEECQMCCVSKRDLIKHGSTHKKKISATSDASTSKADQTVVIKEEKLDEVQSDAS